MAIPTTSDLTQYRADILFKVNALAEAELTAFFDAVAEDEMDEKQTTIEVKMPLDVEPTPRLDRPGTNKVSDI